MIVNLFTRTFNNETSLQAFIDFYKQRIPTVIIHIHDIASTDKTLEIAKENKCVIKNYNDFYTSKDNWRNWCWKYVPSDCIVICDINEYIDITPTIFKNCSIVQTKGFDISDLNNLETKVRNDQYDKFCIFDPHVIKDMHYDGYSCNPQGYIRIGELKPELYHLTKLK